MLVQVFLFSTTASSEYQGDGRLEQASFEAAVLCALAVGEERPRMLLELGVIAIDQCLRWH